MSIKKGSIPEDFREGNEGEKGVHLLVGIILPIDHLVGSSGVHDAQDGVGRLSAWALSAANENISILRISLDAVSELTYDIYASQ